MSQNPITPKGITSLLYKHFDDVHQAAISHVVTDENGDHLYLALIRAGSGDKTHQGGATQDHKHRPGKEHKAEGQKAAAEGHTAGIATPAGANADPAGSVDDMDVSMSRHLVTLLHQPVMWDACNDKQHCGGAGPAHRPRRKHLEPRVPADRARVGVEEHAPIENGNPATTVSHDDVAGLFKVMDKVSSYGLKDEPVVHGGDAA
jgi:hypothetical protein